MQTSQSREIDGLNWTVSQFSGTEGWRLGGTLLRLASGSIVKIIQAWPSGKSILDAELSDPGLFAAGVAEFFATFDEDEFDAITKRLLANTIVAFEKKNLNAKGSFDLVFQGRYHTLIKVLGFVLEVNFAGPLADLLGVVSVASEAVREKQTA